MILPRLQSGRMRSLQKTAVSRGWGSLRELGRQNATPPHSAQAGAGTRTPCVLHPNIPDSIYPPVLITFYPPYHAPLSGKPGGKPETAPVRGGPARAWQFGGSPGTPPGGVYSEGGARHLDRIRPHAQIFYAAESFLGSACPAARTVAASSTRLSNARPSRPCAPLSGAPGAMSSGRPAGSGSIGSAPVAGSFISAGRP